MLVEGVAVKGVYRQKMNLDFSGIVGRSSLFLGFGKDVGGRGVCGVDFPLCCGVLVVVMSYKHELINTFGKIMLDWDIERRCD